MQHTPHTYRRVGPCTTGVGLGAVRLCALGRPGRCPQSRVWVSCLQRAEHLGEKYKFSHPHRTEAHLCAVAFVSLDTGKQGWALPAARRLIL